MRSQQISDFDNLITQKTDNIMAHQALVDNLTK